MNPVLYGYRKLKWTTEEKKEGSIYRRTSGVTKVEGWGGLACFSDCRPAFLLMLPVPLWCQVPPLGVWVWVVAGWEGW